MSSRVEFFICRHGVVWRVENPKKWPGGHDIDARATIPCTCKEASHARA